MSFQPTKKKNTNFFFPSLCSVRSFLHCVLSVPFRCIFVQYQPRFSLTQGTAQVSFFDKSFFLLDPLIDHLIFG